MNNFYFRSFALLKFLFCLVFVFFDLKIPVLASVKRVVIIFVFVLVTKIALILLLHNHHHYHHYYQQQQQQLM